MKGQKIFNFSINFSIILIPVILNTNKRKKAGAPRNAPLPCVAWLFPYAFLARLTSSVNPAESLTAMSASILRFTVMLARLRPLIKVL